MRTYLVGGAVRDKLLGIPVRERDWVVVGATVEEMLRRKYVQVGKDFPVFLHPDTHEEYALARTERKTGPGYKGFEVNASPQVTLDEDLQRRDLTVNSIALDEQGTLFDPYGGQADIEARVLRHVSPAFREDPLRVLRVARFAARFANFGFRVADETVLLMKKIVESGELEHLVAERVWRELETALKEQAPVVFVKVLRHCNALKIILPEVDNLFGVPQPEKYHPEIDTGVHTLMCVEQATRLSDDPVVRYATLIHDVGKGVTPESKWPSHHGHEKFGLSLQKDITTRLRVPNEYAQLARLVCEYHTHMHRLRELRPSTLLSLLESLDGFRRPERIQQFLLACEADAKGRTGLEQRPYPQKEMLMAALRAAAAVDVGALLKDRPKPEHDVKSFVRQKRMAAIQAQRGSAEPDANTGEH